ncbi:MAG: VanZ family protein [Planctomycetes bacterium]|nr:VanZ family protein [Planctomycetota bacterium]
MASSRTFRARLAGWLAQRAVRQALAIAYLLLFSTLLLIPNPGWLLGGWDVDDWSPWTGVDLVAVISYLVHFGGYAVLVAVGLWVLDWTSQRGLAFALALAVLHGVTAEVLQLAVPNRTFDVLDILADSAGCLIGVWVMHRRREVHAARAR